MIFVTGGTGLVGSYLLLALAQSGEKVRALKRKNSNLQAVQNLFNNYAPELFNQIEWVNGDVLDIYSLTEAMEGIAKVYHCAALVSFNHQDRDKMMKNNVEGTANIVNVALEKRIKKFCHVSSTAAIGKTKSYKISDEETPWDTAYPHSSYAISKYLSEQEVWRAAAEGLNMIIVNPCIVLGAGEWGRSSTDIFSKVAKGLRFYTSGSNAFVDVRDVTRIMMQLMKSDIFNERFLLISENLTHKEILNKIAHYLGKPKPDIRISKLVGEIGWRMEKIKCMLLGSKPRITKEAIRSAQRHYRYSNNKIKEQLGTGFISVEQSVNDTCHLFLKQMNKK